MPHAQMVAEQVITQWVMEARHSSMAEDVRWEDAILHVEGVETRSEASVVPPPIEPNIVLTGSELPSSSSTVPSADATGQP